MREADSMKAPQPAFAGISSEGTWTSEQTGGEVQLLLTRRRIFFSAREPTFTVNVVGFANILGEERSYNTLKTYGLTIVQY